jgi:hypothetical protein
LRRELISQLPDNRFADQQFVFEEHVREQVSAQTSRRECRDEHVRVEKDPHDTSRKTLHQ